jgi:hypothetical protein
MPRYPGPVLGMLVLAQAVAAQFTQQGSKLVSTVGVEWRFAGGHWQKF